MIAVLANKDRVFQRFIKSLEKNDAGNYLRVSKIRDGRGLVFEKIVYLSDWRMIKGVEELEQFLIARTINQPIHEVEI